MIHFLNGWKTVISVGICLLLNDYRVFIISSPPVTSPMVATLAAILDFAKNYKSG